jgi:phenylpropionate dioxygenase-like ring-hydroxylating dioxygenase large terminal subunit
MDIFPPRLQPLIIYIYIYIYILLPLLTHCPPPSACQNLSQHTTLSSSSWLARPFSTTHWTPLLYKHTFLTSWHTFYLRPWRRDKQVIPKRWSYTKKLTPGNNPKTFKQHYDHGGSLQLRKVLLVSLSRFICRSLLRTASCMDACDSRGTWYMRFEEVRVSRTAVLTGLSRVHKCPIVR